jgi:tRNA (adenine37-N6)-methyltransferase
MHTNIVLKPVAYVRNSRKEIIDDDWQNIISEIELVDEFPIESFDGIDTFSHLNIIFFFHKSTKTISAHEHPRGNTQWPKVGIFAQRKKNRPNHLGLTTVNLIRIEGRRLIVSNLDAINGTPVLDIKPVLKEFLPKGEITQPQWASKIMEKYWSSGS